MRASGLTLALIGRLDDADAAFRHSLRIDPEYEKARNSLELLQKYRNRPRVD
jgi:hypothetical protein